MSVTPSILSDSKIKKINHLTFFSENVGAYVTVIPRKSSVRFRAWWKGGEVILSSPAAASEHHVREALGRLAPLLRNARPTRLYDLGRDIMFPEGTISITGRNALHGYIESHTDIPEDGHYRVKIEVPSDINLDDPGVVRSISTVICKRMRWIAHLEIIPLAKRIADRIGRHPVGWEISRGHRILGNCDSQGIIRLSLVLIFLPPHLREYVICHEIAHLSEMNHSQRFHALLDSYLAGHEKELMKELKSFRWPIVR